MVNRLSLSLGVRNLLLGRKVWRQTTFFTKTSPSLVGVLLRHPGLHPCISDNPHQAGTSPEEGRLHPRLHPEDTRQVKTLTSIFLKGFLVELAL